VGERECGNAGLPLLFVGFFANDATAQQDACVELARVLGQNFSKSLDVDEQRAIAKADMCSERFTGSSTATGKQIAASYNSSPEAPLQRTANFALPRMLNVKTSSEITGATRSDPAKPGWSPTKAPRS